MVPHWAFLRCRGHVCSPLGAGGGVQVSAPRDVLLLLSLSAQLTTQLHQESSGFSWVRGMWDWGGLQKWAHRNRY